MSSWTSARLGLETSTDERISSSSWTRTLLTSRNSCSSSLLNFLVRTSVTNWLNYFQHSRWFSRRTMRCSSFLFVFITESGLRHKVEQVFGFEENHSAAAHFAGGDLKAAKMKV